MGLSERLTCRPLPLTSIVAKLSFLSQRMRNILKDRKKILKNGKKDREIQDRKYKIKKDTDIQDLKK